MTLAAFKTLVRDEMNRGTTLDSAIDSKARQAVRWMERNSKLRYMHRWVSFTIDSSVADPRIITPPTLIRSLDFFRIVAADSGGNDLFSYLTKVNPMDVDSVPKTQPTCFWFDADQFMVLNATPDQDYNAEIGYWQHTDVAALADGSEHWLFDNAEDVLLHHVMMGMAPYVKESTSFFELHTLLRNSALETLLLAEDDFEQGPSAQISMGIFRE